MRHLVFMSLLQLQHRAIRQDAIIIENVGSSCADTLKHIKNLYDQTRYLKGVINRVC